MKISRLNVGSLTNNVHYFLDYFSDTSFDVLALTETWLISSIPDANISFDGYNIIRKDRGIGRGGGTCFYVSNGIHFKSVTFNQHNDSFEFCIIILQMPSKSSYCFKYIALPR